MPITIPQAVDDQSRAAVTKSLATRNIPKYLLSAMFAGAYVGIAVVLLVSVTAPIAASGSGFAKIVGASVFGIALTLVVFAGGELFTGNAMVMLQGWWSRLVRPREVGVVWALSLFGNIVGSLIFALVVHASGVMAGPGEKLIATMTAAKDAAAGPQLFWRAVLCNALVCLALWMAARAVTDGAKLAVLWWALLAFIGSGFEHSIANATLFGLGALEGSVGWSALARNLAWTVPGNIVGGGIVIGVGYAWLGHQRSVEDSVPTAAAHPAPEAVPAGAQ